MIMFLSPRKAAIATKVSAPKPGRSKAEAPAVTTTQAQANPAES
jgi:hypothetical protein